MGQFFGNLYQPSDFYTRVKDFTRASYNELIDKIQTEYDKYIGEQRQFVQQNHSEDERQAYAISDTIAPKYLYQLCSGSNQL